MKRINHQGGAAIITAVIFFLTISVIILVSISTPIANQVRNASDFLLSKQGYISADTLNEEALYRLNKGRTLPSSIVLAFSQSTSTAQITDVSGMKQVIATGVSGALSRVAKSLFSLGDGVSINYGLQTGNGGLNMSGSPTITGNVYSNGNIVGSGVSTITGSAVASVAATLTADQENTAVGTPAVNSNFGNAAATQDIAQGFTVSTSTPLAQARFYIRKVGSPSNITVRILTNSGGSPSNTTIASATISASQVTTSYGWVTVSFVGNPALTPGTTYWVALDMSSNNSSNYYQLATTNSSAYAAGQLKTGSVGGSWTVPNATYDAFFQMYTGGVSTISGVVVGSSGSGDARAFVVNNSTVAGTIYCQSGTGNNKSCDTSQTIPSPLNFPVSDANIEEWKASAEAGGTRTGWSLPSYGATSTNAVKIVGNLNIGGSVDVTLNGPLYVTGNLSVSGAGKLRLASSYGATSGIIVVDGTVSLAGSGAVSGSGTAGSYIMIVSNSTANPAITVNGAAGAVVLVAPDGWVTFEGSASAKSAMAYGMNMTGATTLTYESGLADLSFSSGPSGSWNVDSWREISQ